MNQFFFCQFLRLYLRNYNFIYWKVLFMLLRSIRLKQLFLVIEHFKELYKNKQINVNMLILFTVVRARKLAFLVEFKAFCLLYSLVMIGDIALRCSWMDLFYADNILRWIGCIIAGNWTLSFQFVFV